MEEHYFIDENVWIHKENYSLRPQNIYSKKTLGKIKGIKKYNRNTKLYLIEFLNHNRIWLIKKEIKKI